MNYRRMKVDAERELREAAIVRLTREAPGSYEWVAAVFDGSNADATKALYAQLFAKGAAGAVAVNLLRAWKASSRAKVYRGGTREGSYRGMAYDKKAWSIGELCTTLERSAEDLGIAWGWQRDRDTPGFEWVLYVETPRGQVSFHAASRGAGPDFPGAWDRVRGLAPRRLCRWAADLLNDQPSTERIMPDGLHAGTEGTATEGAPRTTRAGKDCDLWDVF